jgi:hypothetical protein
MGNLSLWLLFVSMRNETESAIVGRSNSKAISFREGVRSAAAGQSGCLECHMGRCRTFPLVGYINKEHHKKHHRRKGFRYQTVSDPSYKMPSFYSVQRCI